MHGTYAASFVWIYINNEKKAQNAIRSCAFGPSTTRNLIMRVLSINHVKRTNSTALKQKRFDFSSLSPALRNLRFLLVLLGTNLSPLQMLMNVKKKLTDVT